MLNVCRPTACVSTPSIDTNPSIEPTKNPEMVVFSFGHARYGECGLEAVDTSSLYSSSTPQQQENMEEASPALFQDLSCVLWPQQIKRLLNRRPAQVCAARDYSLVVTADGALFSFGNGDNGNLGHGYKQFTAAPWNEMQPKCISHLRPEKVVQVDAFSAHTVVLTVEGKVYTFGVDGNDGRLGHGFQAARTSIPILVSTFRSIHIIQVAAGRAHTLALAEEGAVYSFGAGRDGRLGHGDMKDVGMPRQIDNFVKSQKQIKFIDAGGCHSIFITCDGETYTCGSNTRGQCGHIAIPPTATSATSNRGLDISMPMAETRNSKGKGEGASDGVGVSECQCFTVPTLVVELKHVRASSASLSIDFSLLLTDEGEVYSFGERELCGRGPDALSKPMAVDLGDTRAVQVSAGHAHSLVLTERILVDI
jgi:alpha-tubulin suppressor-like RCC1 family protein